MTLSFPVTLVSIVLDHHHTEILLIFTIFAGPTLETKGIRAMFQKKGKNGAKYLTIWTKMYKI